MKNFYSERIMKQTIIENEEFMCKFIKETLFCKGDIEYVGCEQRLPTGVCDLLYKHTFKDDENDFVHFIIVELKNRLGHTDDISQLKRYVYGAKEVLKLTKDFTAKNLFCSGILICNGLHESLENEIYYSSPSFALGSIEVFSFVDTTHISRVGRSDLKLKGNEDAEQCVIYNIIQSSD